MDWLVGALTLVSMELVARRRWEGWAVGLANQALWAYLVVWRARLWGLAPLSVLLTWRYAAALARWRREGAGR